MLLAKREIVLTDRSKDIRNKAIRKCDRSKLDGMYTFVTIIENPLVFSRPCNWPNSSINKAKAVVEWSPFLHTT